MTGIVRNTPATLAIVALEKERARLENEVTELRDAITAYFRFADANGWAGKTRAEWEASASLTRYAREHLRELVGIPPRPSFINETVDDD